MSLDDKQGAPADPAASSADVAALLSEAKAVDAGEAGPAPDGAPGQPGALALPDRRALAIGTAETVLAVALPLVEALAPRYGAAYGKPQRAAIVEAFASLAVAQGWDMGEALGRYGPWLALGAAVVGPVLPMLIEDARSRGQEAAPTPAGLDAAGDHAPGDPAAAVGGERVT